MIVAITLIISAVDGKYHYVRHQMDQMVCWIDLDLIIWCFVLPVSIIIFFNLGVVVMIVNIAYHSASHQRFVLIHNNFLIPLYMSHFELKHFFQYRRKKRWSKIFKITRHVLILSVLLGVTWLLGFLLPALNGWVSKSNWLLIRTIENICKISITNFLSKLDECFRASNGAAEFTEFAFIVINGSMGVYIFLYSVVFNKKVNSFYLLVLRP